MKGMWAAISIGRVNQKFLVTIIETFRCIECFVRRAAGGSFAKAARCISDTRCGVKDVAKQEVSVSYRGNFSHNGTEPHAKIREPAPSKPRLVKRRCASIICQFRSFSASATCLSHADDINRF